MVGMAAIYQGEKHCLLTHDPSLSTIETDAPRDNQGKGERFSPTDLMGAALMSCALTTVAIHGEKRNLNFVGATARITKEMVSDPRRISKLKLTISMPSGIAKSEREFVQKTADGCPVKLSLHPTIECPIEIIYPD